jgi:hypothetical protein
MGDVGVGAASSNRGCCAGGPHTAVPAPCRLLFGSYRWRCSYHCVEVVYRCIEIAYRAMKVPTAIAKIIVNQVAASQSCSITRESCLVAYQNYLLQKSSKYMQMRSSFKALVMRIAKVKIYRNSIAGIDSYRILKKNPSNLAGLPLFFTATHVL